ncbi:MAG: nucleotidyltransferase domain-containing protein [bacterium]|nr:nucleotidyltransferase domain-containing protein [bacterium]
MISMREEGRRRREADPWPTLEAAIREATTVAEHARAFYGDSLKSVWLYGSRARQDNAPDSDLDVLLVREPPEGLDATKEKRDLFDGSFQNMLEEKMRNISMWPWPIQVKSSRPEQLETWDTMFFLSVREDAIRIL